MDFKFSCDKQADGLWVCEVVGIPQTVFCDYNQAAAKAGAAQLGLKRIRESAEEDIAKLESDILRLESIGEFFAEASVLVLVFIPIAIYESGNSFGIWALPGTLILCIVLYQIAIRAKQKHKRLEKQLKLIRSMRHKDLQESME